VVVVLLSNAHASDIYLTGLGGLLTFVHLAGLLFRPAKERARLGIDSTGCWPCTSAEWSGW